MLNKKDSHQCRRIEVQSKEMPTVRWSAAWPCGWWRIAAQQAAGSLPWIGVDEPSKLLRLQADRAARTQESANFQLGGPEKAFWSPRPAARAAEKRRLGRPVVDGDIMCHPTLVPSSSPDFERRQRHQSWSGTNPQETEVIYHVNNQDSAPRGWRIHDAQSMAKVSTGTARSITSGTAGCRNLRRGWAAVS